MTAPTDDATEPVDASIVGQFGHVFQTKPAHVDDLTAIWGIGEVNQTRLNEIGIYHYDQISNWTADVIEAVNGLLGFKGRIEREQWVAQAKKLAAHDHVSDAA